MLSASDEELMVHQDSDQEFLATKNAKMHQKEKILVVCHPERSEGSSRMVAADGFFSRHCGSRMT
jgi:hypothetical protein